MRRLCTTRRPIWCELKKLPPSGSVSVGCRTSPRRNYAASCGPSGWTTKRQLPRSLASAVERRESSTSWIASFLESRGLSEPDGRPLYAYRCTAEEFDRLRDVLHGTEAPAGAHHFRAFVLYAAQWWQRQYDGGRWAWEPLLDSIGWSMPYPDLYPDVRHAWRWWKVKPVRLPSSTRFLGTFACHGGLPLALVGDAKAPITLYLRAVLGHSLEYGRFVEDTIELAKDKEHLLRPPTLRRDYVFRLAADVVDAVVDLQPDAQGKNPIAALDRDRPDWRDALPLDLDNQPGAGSSRGPLARRCGRQSEAGRRLQRAAISAPNQHRLACGRSSSATAVDRRHSTFAPTRRSWGSSGSNGSARLGQGNARLGGL